MRVFDYRSVRPVAHVGKLGFSGCRVRAVDAGKFGNDRYGLGPADFVIGAENQPSADVLPGNGAHFRSPRQEGPEFVVGNVLKIRRSAVGAFEPERPHGDLEEFRPGNGLVGAERPVVKAPNRPAAYELDDVVLREVVADVVENGKTVVVDRAVATELDATGCKIVLS